MEKLFIYDSLPHEVGKSRSIKAIFHVMKHRKELGVLDLDYKVLLGSDEFADKKDLKALIYYRNTTIGLESQGDPKSRITKSIKEFIVTHKCPVIVCACRTKGKDVRAIKRMCKEAEYAFMAAPNFVIEDQEESLYDCLAEHYADSVIAAIDKWIDLNK